MSGTFEGSLLADRDWLAARVADAKRQWGLTDSRVAATLWWYSASSTLVVSSTAELLRTGTAPDPSPMSITGILDSSGTLSSVRSAARVDGLEAFAAGLRRTLTAIIEPLAEVGAAHAAALWAVASDSLGNRALDAGTALGSPASGSALAIGLAELIGAPIPVPRFVDVGPRRFLRRASCCLIDHALVPDPGDVAAAARAKCVSCPRQRPEVRLARLAAL